MAPSLPLSAEGGENERVPCGVPAAGDHDGKLCIQNSHWSFDPKFSMGIPARHPKIQLLPSLCSPQGSAPGVLPCVQLWVPCSPPQKPSLTFQSQCHSPAKQRRPERGQREQSPGQDGGQRDLAGPLPSVKRPHALRGGGLVNPSQWIGGLSLSPWQVRAGTA